MLSVRQRVFAGPKGVAELPEINELRDLGLADDQLRAVLDFLVVVRQAEASVSRESSVHSMISMNSPRKKSMSPIG